MTGEVFNIQRFSLHDGPGIRTTVFMSGCSLNCRWCHNPEGKLPAPLLQYDDKKCLKCGKCAAVCKKSVHSFIGPEHLLNRSRCDLCCDCVAECPSRALNRSSEVYTSEDVIKLVRRDLSFYGQEGGVTFSGGEPLLQAGFTAECAKGCLECGVPSVAIDTAGNVDRSLFETVLPYTDYFLFDIKCASRDRHVRAAGAPNDLIIENLRWLDRQGPGIFIRIPVIGGINDSNEEMKAIAAIIEPLESVREVRLIPYHSLGAEKYGSVGMDYPEIFGVPDDESMKEFSRITGGVY
ncbi:MAG: glycyl-radical enzyme activating protein [Lachnospiraceae bacterium]|nr:glycyl-radical enzyme activating protein [Lachnospiraceae bacterium]